MTRFLQFHVLTSYPAANLNRDDAGRPKTMVFGNAERLRLSSQSLKRAWRTSPEFRAAIGEANIGARTQEFAHRLLSALIERGLSEKDAVARVRDVITHDKLGKLEAKRSADSTDEDAPPIETNQLVHLGQDEIAALTGLADELAAGNLPDRKDMLILRRHPKAADIALFGRMLADNPGFNVEAAAQVAHAFTTHRTVVEDDYYTAVDDLKAVRPGADAGAGFIGVFEFGSGVFYQYANINLDLLLDNLDGDAELAGNAVAGFAAAMAIANPKGKQNATAARARAGHMRIEIGDRAPRTLSDAFLRPVRVPEHADDDLMARSIAALEKKRNDIDAAYGACVDDSRAMTVGGEGTLADCVAFAGNQVQATASRAG